MWITSTHLSNVRISCTIAISNEPKATVPKWYLTRLEKLVAIGECNSLLFLGIKNENNVPLYAPYMVADPLISCHQIQTTNLVKNHDATAPAITICWHPITNCVIQNIASTLYHRVTLIVAFFTYFADVLFSIFKSPELSIQIAKYNHNPTTVTNAMNVCKNQSDWHEHQVLD